MNLKGIRIEKTKPYYWRTGKWFARVQSGDHKESLRKFWGVMELLCILIVYTCVKIHKTNTKKVNFTCMLIWKRKFKKLSQKTYSSAQLL